MNTAEFLSKKHGGPGGARVTLVVHENAIIVHGPAGGIAKVLPIVRDNEPCVCGSGRKWRKCCQQAHRAEGG